MAVFPCAVGLHRYAGPQTSAYLGLVNGSRAARNKMRLCPAHFEVLWTWLENNTTLSAIGEISQDDGDTNAVSCFQCDSTDRTWSAYANIYPRGEAMHQYFAVLCERHGREFAERGQIDLT